MPILLTVGKVQEEKKGSSLDVKGTVDGVKGGRDTKLKNLLVVGDVGVQWSFPQGVIGDSSRGLFNSSPQAAMAHLE